MRVMVLIKATAESEAEIMPPTELLEAMGKYNQELVEAGVMLGGEGIKPSEHGKRIALDGVENTITDGPFPETNQLIAGFWIWQVADMDEAIAWVRRCPQPMPGMSELEIRPLYEMEDFAPEMTPEQAAQEEELRERVGNAQLDAGNPDQGESSETGEERRNRINAMRERFGTSHQLGAKKRPMVTPSSKRWYHYYDVPVDAEGDGELRALLGDRFEEFMHPQPGETREQRTKRLLALRDAVTPEDPVFDPDNETLYKMIREGRE